MSDFMFATGIECSCPAIEHGRWRMDELAATGHYKFWRRDLNLVRELGLKYLRYGPPILQIFLGPDTFNWDFMDQVCAEMRRLEITPIVDLCHFGIPDWLGNFQNPEFPEQFALYAEAFARRYPWIRFYTPINEMHITARFSALDGAWNEQLRSERTYVTALRHITRGAALAIQRILIHQPRAVFVTSESSEFFQACSNEKNVVQIADFENQRRFIALDLIYGAGLREDILGYLFQHGLTQEEYAWYRGLDLSKRLILGIDYYETNEKLITPSGQPAMLGELFGWYVIAMQYYQRYRRPMMHSETNCGDAEKAPDWLWRQWYNVQLIRQNGVPVVGFTWYSLQDMVDWNAGLTRPVGMVNPVGLFDLNRDPRPVAFAYKHLLNTFRNEQLGNEEAERLLSA
jgi:beta-glucosidase/6-phospho-beta-glucosidase/beta-galactosidase